MGTITAADDIVGTSLAGAAVHGASGAGVPEGTDGREDRPALPSFVEPFDLPSFVGWEELDRRAVEYVMASGACPTCLVDGDEVLDGDPPAAEMPSCPTCGRASMEYALTCEIDARVTALAGLDTLDAAVEG